VEQKKITVISSLALLRETMRYWILSFLRDSISIETRDFLIAPLNCDLCLTIILNENELTLTESLVNRNKDTSVLSVIEPSDNTLYKNEIIARIGKTTDLRGCIDQLLILLKLENSFTETVSDPLTNREREVLELIAQGNCLKEISYMLGISKHTVVAHRRNLCLKTGAKTLQQLTLYATMHQNSLEIS